MQNNHLYHAAMGDFYSMLGDVHHAADAYERALTFTQSKSEIELLQRKRESQYNN
jgi:predicted RNA polymerase sigma factor